MLSRYNVTDKAALQAIVEEVKKWSYNKLSMQFYELARALCYLRHTRQSRRSTLSCTMARTLSSECAQHVMSEAAVVRFFSDED